MATGGYAGGLVIFSFLSFSTKVVRLRLNRMAALFLTQPVFSSASMRSSFSKPSTSFFRLMPSSGIPTRKDCLNDCCRIWVGFPVGSESFSRGVHYSLGTSPRTLSGKSLEVMVEPILRTTIRSTKFANSRMLPGQE